MAGRSSSRLEEGSRAGVRIIQRFRDAALHPYRDGRRTTRRGHADHQQRSPGINRNNRTGNGVCQSRPAMGRKTRT